MTITNTKNNVKQAWDFDGVASEGVFEDGGIIITGRKKEDKQEILDTLDPMIPSKIYNYPNDDLEEDTLNKKIGEWKAKVIKKLGIERFYEDTPEQIQIIKEMNPDTEIIRVKDGEPIEPMKFLIFSYENYFAPIAQKLIEEGNKVVYAQIEDIKHILTDDELKKPDKEDSKETKMRLSLYDGIIKKYPAEKVIKKLDKLKDYIVFADSNSTFRFTEKAEKAGLTGLLHTQDERVFEVDRQKAKEFVKENYPGISLPDVQEFKTIDEGIEFLSESENIYVLKSLGDSGETVVPKNEDPKISNQIVMDTLKKYQKDYETNGYILEQKIMNVVELTPQIVFWDGEPVYTSLDIETKTIGNAELGDNVGCGMNLIVKTDINDKINDIAFPPIVYEMAKGHKGMFIIDAGLLFDLDSDNIYFTEFCTRLGWDAFPTEVAMAGDKDGEIIATRYFERLIRGKNPLKFNFGVGVRIFNLDKKEGLSVTVSDEAKPDTYLYDVKKEDDQIVTVGYQRDVGVITGVGDTLEEAIDRAYEYVGMVGLKDIYYRSKDDFLSENYMQSIMKRYNYAVENNLIDSQEDDIMEE